MFSISERMSHLLLRCKNLFLRPLQTLIEAKATDSLRLAQVHLMEGVLVSLVG